jgi:2-polyprenyl-6-methoxyphenol hydroxylase-like FAD-dependent oxidoreductase
MRTNLNIVGAGPVGLTAVLAAARHGLSVRVFDARSAPEHNHATLVHSDTLELLASLGIADAIEQVGRRVECLSLHVAGDRIAELDLTRSSRRRPYLVAVSQGVVERALLDAAMREADVLWNHEVTDVIDHGDRVEVVTARDQSVSDFVIGADGYGSLVRRAAGIDVIDLESTESWALFEATLERDLGHEAHLGLQDELVTAIWPLPERRARLSFQLFRALHAAPDLTLLQTLVSERAPWLRTNAVSVEWSSVSDFEHLLASRFGEGNVWLAGEAAHITSPAGTHSLNVGLREGSDLARYVSDSIRGIVTRDVFALYERQRQREWRRLLGIGLDVRHGPRAPTLLRPYLVRLIPCLPASGAELDAVMARLDVRFLEREGRAAHVSA